MICELCGQVLNSHNELLSHLEVKKMEHSLIINQGDITHKQKFLIRDYQSTLLRIYTGDYKETTRLIYKILYSISPSIRGKYGKNTKKIEANPLDIDLSVKKDDYGKRSSCAIGICDPVQKAILKFLERVREMQFDSSYRTTTLKSFLLLKKLSLKEIEMKCDTLRIKIIKTVGCGFISNRLSFASGLLAYILMPLGLNYSDLNKITLVTPGTIRKHKEQLEYIMKNKIIEG